MFGIGRKMGVVIIVALLIVAAVGYMFLVKPVDDTAGSRLTMYIEDEDGNVYSATADVSTFTSGESAMALFGQQPRFVPLAIAEGQNVGQTIKALDYTRDYSVGFRVDGSVSFAGVSSINSAVAYFTGKNYATADRPDRVGDGPASDGSGVDFLYGEGDSTTRIGVPIVLNTTSGKQTFSASSSSVNQHFINVNSKIYSPGFPSQTLNLPIEGRNLQGSIWQVQIIVSIQDTKGATLTSTFNCSLTITAEYASGVIGLMVDGVTLEQD